MDFQCQFVHIGDDDDDLKILGSITPIDSVRCDSKSPKKAKTTTSDVWNFFQNVVLRR